LPGRVGTTERGLEQDALLAFPSPYDGTGGSNGPEGPQPVEQRGTKQVVADGVRCCDRLFDRCLGEVRSMAARRRGEPLGEVRRPPPILAVPQRLRGVQAPSDRFACRLDASAMVSVTAKAFSLTARHVGSAELAGRFDAWSRDASRR
jgi:hypothetical protein